jgi:pyridoxal phosphate enzyme (YggS family)
MLIPYEEFKRRAEELQAAMAQACRAAGRPEGAVRLLAVTKTHPPSAAEYAARFGLGAVGENRVQEAMEKRPAAPAGLRWELIGHLQSNKAGAAVATFDRIQSVDSVKLVDKLARAAADCGKRLPILLQINAGDDPAKFGADLAEADRLVEAALRQPSLLTEGLMTIAPLSPDPAVAARTFANLREVRDRLAGQFGCPLAELSMGMSGDFAAAIAAGSTVIRVGTALFGAR